MELCGAEQVTAGHLSGFAKSSDSAVHEILAPSHVTNESVRKVVILNSSQFSFLLRWLSSFRCFFEFFSF